jgi:hypothetical protein
VQLPLALQLTLSLAPLALRLAADSGQFLLLFWEAM